MSAIPYVPDYIHHPDPANVGVTGEFLTGNGSPVGVVTPGYAGQGYIDLDVPQLWFSSGLTSADWELVSGVVGSQQLYGGDFADPNGNVTPTGPTFPAMYRQDSNLLNRWDWMPGTLTWVQWSG
jgi:hypothetical protein